MSIESVMVSDHLILCRPLLHLPSIFPIITVFSNESAIRIRWPEYGVSVSVSVLPMSIQGWIPFGLTGLICAVQGTVRSLLQNHNAKASILQFSAFFMVLPSHLYMTTGKTRALSMGKSVGTVMSLLYNLLLRFIIAFLPKSKCLLISWLQSL